MDKCWCVVDKDGRVKPDSMSETPAAVLADGERYCFTTVYHSVSFSTKVGPGLSLIDEGNGHATLERSYSGVSYYQVEVRAVGNTLEDVTAILNKAKELIYSSK